MKTSRSLSFILLALVSAVPMLHAVDDPRGQYEGTIQCTDVNEQYISQRGFAEIEKQPAGTRIEQENRDIALDQQKFANNNYLSQLKLAKITNVNPFSMMIMNGDPGSQYALETGPASSNYIQVMFGNLWHPTANNQYGAVQSSWRSDGFEIIRTQGATAYRIAGTYSGATISGQWSVTENGTRMLAGVFTATNKDQAAGGSKKKSSSSESAPIGGRWVHTGEGNDADDYTWEPDSAPSGISGVGQVPGPADMGETGTGLILPGLLAVAGIGLKSMLDATVTPPPLVDYGASPDTSGTDGSATADDSGSDSTGTRNADGSTALTGENTDQASATTPPASEYGANYDQAMKNFEEASNNYNNMLQQYADFQNGADKNDPNYQALDQQYKDYLSYWKQQADSSKADADGIASAVEKSRNTQVLKDYWGNDKEVVYDPTTGLWHDAQTGNLFDPDAWQKSQQDDAKADAWGQSETQKMENQQDSDSKAMNQLIAQQKVKERELQYIEKLQEVGFNKGIIDPGGQHDFFTATQKMMDDIQNGNTVTIPQIRDAAKYLHDRLTGSAQPESSLSLPGNYVDDWQTTKTALWNSAKELATGKDSNGNFTVAGVIGMIGLHAVAAATGGAQELLFGVGRKWVGEAAITAASTVFTEQDAIDHGAGTLGAIGAGALEGGLALVGAGVGEGVHMLASNPGVRAGVGEMFEPVTNFGRRLIGSAAPGALTPELQATKNLVTKVLESKDPKDLAKLYSNGGMEKLGQLQAAGHLSQEEAKALNAQLHPLLNQHIDQATVSAIQNFQKQTGVRIEQTIIADSGSTAKMGRRFDSETLQNYADSHGMTVDEASKELQTKFGNAKAVTDRDATHVTRFNQEDLEQYARDHSISVEEANNKLQNLYGNNIKDNVNQSLIDKGFQGGANDVKFQTYSGIGSGSGRADSYGAGFTGRRAEIGGNGTEWTTDASGNVVSTQGRQISGTAVVDQHGLNVMQVTGELPPNPNKFSPDEFHLYSQQQVNAVIEHSDPKSVAKAMMRQKDLAKAVDNMSGNAYSADQLAQAGITKAPPPMNQKLATISQQIADNPDSADQILSNANLTHEQYRRQVLREVQNYHSALTGES